jgi:outer membrane protein, multidrug efflux system
MNAPLFIAAALLLAGCASHVPTVPPPAVAKVWLAPVPGQAHAGPDAAPSAALSLGAAYPLLQGLIQAAQRASPTLAVAADRIEAARSAAVGVGAALQPLAEATASASSGRSDPAAPVSRRLAVGLQASWEIDLFGRLAAGQDAARARVDAALSAWHDGRVSLAAEVTQAYISLRACEALLEQGEIDLHSRAETARLTALSANAGFVAPADAALARASAAQARSQQAQTRLVCERQVKALTALTAIDEPALREQLLPGRAQVPVLSAVAVPAVPAQLLLRRPDLLEAQARLQAAAADLLQAERDRLPSLSLVGQIGLGHSVSAGRSARGSTWSLGPLQLSLPVLDGGIQAAQQQAALAGYDSARIQLEARVRDAVRDVEQALLGVQTSGERLADARLAAEGFEVALRATQARQRGGLASLFELEEARRQTVAARHALIELDQQRASSWVSLYRALGGGWSAGDAGPPAPTGPTPARTS